MAVGALTAAERDAEIDRLTNAVEILEQRLIALETGGPTYRLALPDLEPVSTLCVECGSAVDHFDNCPHYTPPAG